MRSIVDAGLGRPVEQPDHPAVHQGVHFHDDVAAPARLLVRDLPLDQPLDRLPQVDGGDRELAVVGLGRIPGQVVEQIGRVRPDGVVAGQKARGRCTAGR